MNDIFALVRDLTVYAVCAVQRLIHCWLLEFSLLLSCVRAYAIVFELFVKIVYCAKTMTITFLYAFS